MKRQLLLSTGIVSGAALLLAGPAVAGDVKTGAIDLTIGGSYEFQLGIGDDDLDTNDRGHDFVTDTEIHFNFASTTDNGLTFGATVELEVDQGTSGNSDEVWGFISGDFGRIEMGDQDGAEDRMAYGGENTQAGLGGIDGDQGNFFTITAAALTTPDITDSGDATKITYFTPRFSGVQAGVSYTPDLASSGRNVATDNDSQEDHFGFGLNFVETFNGVDVAVGAVAGFSDSGVAGVDDNESYAIGALIGYGGAQFGASFGSDGDSGARDDSYFWDVGIGYSQGPWGISVGYLHTEAEADGTGLDSDYDLFAIAGDYSVAPGLTIKADVYIQDSDNDGTAGDNDATNLLISTVVSF